MSKSTEKKNRRGQGDCGNPFCRQPRAKDAFLCAEHRDQIHAIRDAALNDPHLLYNQRSDNANRVMDRGRSSKGSRRAPKVPVCCLTGCFEPRVPPDHYCDAHAGEVVYD